jgi:hypothetical protein
MTAPRVKELCRLCDVKIYSNGEKVDVSDGAILIRGTLQVLPDQNSSETRAQRQDQTSAIGGPTKISDIGFIVPRQGDVIMAETESEDYTVLLRLPAGLRDRVIAASGTVNSAMVTALYKKSLGKGVSAHDGEDLHRNAPSASNLDPDKDCFGT